MATGNDVEVEADRRAAEDSGCAVTVKANQQSHSDHCEMPNEAPKPAEEDADRRRGRGQGWGRGRPRASRFRSSGHYGQGSQHENHATESDVLDDKNSGRRVSPSYAGCDVTSDKRLPSGDWDTGPPSESSAFHPHESQSRPTNGGQKPRESSRGQRAMPGRGHSRGPFAKFVTVPDASHSHDVRHVEEVNNSIVINIDRSTRSGGDSIKRGGGRGSGGGGGGYIARSNSTGETLEDGAGANVGDQETGVLPSSYNAPHQKGGYRGQGRRPFRARGDGSFRGRGEGSFRGQGQGRADGFRRGYGEGPRPFRGGYKPDRARGGRNSRRAVIVTSKSDRGDSSQLIPGPEDLDKIVPAADTAGEAGASDGLCWTGAEDGSAKWEESEGNHDPDRSEAFHGSRSYEESHKELGLHEGEEVAHQNQPEETEQPTVEQSECHLDGTGYQPNADLADTDKSIFTPAEHSPNSTKPCESISELRVEGAMGSGSGTHAVEKLKDKSSSDTETNTESKPLKTNTVPKPAEVENPSSHNNDSHDLVPGKLASGESKDATKQSDLEIAGAVNLSACRKNSHDFVPEEKAVNGDSERSVQEMSSSKSLPPKAAAAAESIIASVQSEVPADVPVGESNSSDPSKPADNGLVEKPEALSSEIPASVEEKT